MSTRVHRCRFLDYVPHGIESVDAEPGPNGRLAVLRANADIEVWSLRQGETHCELRIAGAVDTPVRRVAWGARSPRWPAGRLFSCGLHGLVTEWDLRSLSPRASWDSMGGAAWTMAIHVESRLMAVGCEDGGCSIFDFSDEDEPEPRLVHRTPPQGGRLLSVSFSPTGSHLACSAADGSVRVWHVASWQALSRYVLESTGRKKPPLVWSVLLLSDLTVVSGDSLGRVSFYDGRHGTLVRVFASHQADVLALAASADEERVFASGVDQKVRLFRFHAGDSHGGTHGGTHGGAHGAGGPSLRRVPLPESVGAAASCAFSPDERLLLLGGLSGLLQTVALTDDDAAEEDTPSTAVHTFRAAPAETGAPASAPRPAIIGLAMSDDGQWIATLDAAKRVLAYSVDGLCFASAVPPLPAPPTAMAFVPGSALVAVATADKRLALYDVDSSALTPWSLKNAKPVPGVAGSSEVPHTITANPAKPGTLILCAQSWMCSVPVDGADGGSGAAAEEAAAATAAAASQKKKKRRRGGGADDETAVAAAPAAAAPAESRVVRSYGGMVLFDYLEADAAVVVEQPWLRVMEHFPPALFRQRFGT